MDVDKAIKSRHSVRNFTNKRPDWRKIIEAIETARYAPMAGNIFTAKFILIEDKEKIAKIAKACQQSFITQAQYVVVVCSIPDMLHKNFPDEAKVYQRQQAGAAIQNFLLKLTDLGLATCWVGLFVESQIKKELKIPDKADVEALFPIGFEKASNRGSKSPKGDVDKIISFHEYGNKKMRPEGRGEGL